MDLDRFAVGWTDTGPAPPPDSAAIAGHLEGGSLLAPLITAEIPALTDQLETAKMLADATDATLHITNSIRIPEQPSPELHSDAVSDADLELLDWAIEQAPDPTSQVDGTLVYSRRLVTGVLQTIATHDVDTVVLPGTSPGDFLRGDVTEQIATQADCDVIVVNGQAGLRSVPSILVPVAGGPHSGLATDIAGHIASSTDGWIDILHVLPEDSSGRQREQAETYVESAARRVARPDTTSTWILESDDPTDVIVEQSQYYPLTVIGAPTKGRLRRLIYGSTNRTIRRNANCVVLSARNNRASGRSPD